MIARSRPALDEYPAALAGYVGRIGEEEEVLAVLADQLDELPALLGRSGEGLGDYRYTPGKWTVKEVVGHLSDTERILSCRALRFARGDATPLASFDDQAYVAELGAAGRMLSEMIGEWSDVRRAALALFRHLSAAAWCRRGIASDQPISVRALAYVIAGHTRHHVETLRARYIS
ncbi:MAG TPA: DinB family protein [Gemmatimonadales bacterium]|nr:DinB family protein [Gemmatimonadales bacterium]